MYNKCKIFLRRFMGRFVDAQTGATAIEYGLLIAILGAGLIVGTDGIAVVITDMWDGINGNVTGS
ncbi:MAG: Flp family type IVb pilin [Robiginitomaculum sp.]|nr:MAG: Flp family type IVb pilin [Robiginitomaculum sp.]